MLFVSSLLLAAAVSPTAAQQDFGTLAAPVKEQVVTWRRDFHQHPELGNVETRTAKIVAEHLQSLGMQVKTGIAKTGVVAILEGGKPGPLIALRADMDALPVTEETGLPFASKATTLYRNETVGVMHACGHDAHVAILMGVAKALADNRAALAGRVMFIFQPAEEGAPDGEEGGADLMLAEGIFSKEKPVAIFGLHVWSQLNVGKIGLRSGPLMASSDTFSIKVKGVQTHGSSPWRGVDPILAASQIVVGLQSIVSRQVNISKAPAVITVGMIKGGIRQNIIPDEVNLLGTIRNFDMDIRDDVFKRIENTASHIAQASGASAEFKLMPGGYPVTANDAELTKRMWPVLESVVGKESVLNIDLVTGAEDFSFFAQQTPGLYFFVGVTPKGKNPMTEPSNHSPHFFIDEEALQVGTKAMLAVVLDYLK